MLCFLGMRFNCCDGGQGQPYFLKLFKQVCYSHRTLDKHWQFNVLLKMFKVHETEIFDRHTITQLQY